MVVCSSCVSLKISQLIVSIHINLSFGITESITTVHCLKYMKGILDALRRFHLDLYLELFQ